MESIRNLLKQLSYMAIFAGVCIAVFMLGSFVALIIILVAGAFLVSEGIDYIKKD